MLDRDQQLIEAAMSYLTLLDGDTPVSVEQFVADATPELRGELQLYLEEILALGMPGELPVLSPAEHALAARVGRDSTMRLTRALTGSVFPSLNEARAVCKLSLVALAQQLNLPPDLLERIERGDITLSTIPARLISRLAALLDQSETEIRALLGEPGPRLAPQVREVPQPYDLPVPSDQVDGGGDLPHRHTVSFAEALAASKATPAQREAWSRPE
jgi:hypothetical protein